MTDSGDLSTSARGPTSIHPTPPITTAISTSISAPPTNNSATTTPAKSSTYTFDPTARSKELPTDPSALRTNLAAIRPQGPGEIPQVGPAPVSQPPTLASGDTFIPNPVDGAFGHKGTMNKAHLNPVTALVPPMVGIPDGGATLTQEQWENRKSKIAQLEKIHSTLSKSKSASTPGAVAAAAGAVLQQQQHRLQGAVGPPPMPPSSLAQPPGSLPQHPLGMFQIVI
ncbi:unnamed protein product [Echinostoma caproni]|uniref:P66_CC domain-containing protein n=1 Tax=Echinostoma caproni TaxID=27848 RepID=A0A183AM58_9TREM|nr:unnamed protein product [Echinostoma caproni]